MQARRMVQRSRSPDPDRRKQLRTTGSWNRMRLFVRPESITVTVNRVNTFEKHENTKSIASFVCYLRALTVLTVTVMDSGERHVHVIVLIPCENLSMAFERPLKGL